MYLVLIAYIILWGAMVKLYNGDIFIIIGGLLILISLVIGISKTKEDKKPMSKHKKNKSYKSKKI